jgi:hypothetical protein
MTVIPAMATGSAIKTPFSRQERPAACPGTFTRPSATDAANPAKPRFNRALVAFPLNSLARLGVDEPRERACRVRGRAAARPWVEPNSLENGFRRDAENGYRDGRAAQQSPNRAANGSLGWTSTAKGV